MNILRNEILDLHEGLIAAVQMIEDLTTNDLWDDSKYKAKSKVT